MKKCDNCQHFLRELSQTDGSFIAKCARYPEHVRITRPEEHFCSEFLRLVPKDIKVDKTDKWFA